MPKHGQEILLTQLEIDIMAAFVKHKIFNDQDVALALDQLAAKVCPLIDEGAIE